MGESRAAPDRRVGDVRMLPLLHPRMNAHPFYSGSGEYLIRCGPATAQLWHHQKQLLNFGGLPDEDFLSFLLYRGAPGGEKERYSVAMATTSLSTPTTSNQQEFSCGKCGKSFKNRVYLSK